MALPHVNVDQLREERYILGEKTLIGLLENCPKNQTIGDNLIRAWSKINSDKYEKIVCAISGGWDSDIVLDICKKCDKDNKIEYVWFDTGLEYQATKDHLKFLKISMVLRLSHIKQLNRFHYHVNNMVSRFFQNKSVSSCRDSRNIILNGKINLLMS